MIYGLHDFLGIVGVVMVLVAYMMLQIEKLSPTSALYSGVNGLGAALILISLAYDFNLSAVVMEGAWLLISVYGLVRRRV